MSGPEPIAWTGSGSLVALVRGVDGRIWPDQADAHPIPLYSASALRAEREKALREAAAMVRRVYQLSLSDLAEGVNWADDIGDVIAHDIEQIIDGEKP